MSNFRAWVEKSDESFVVRYRDGRRDKNGNLKKFSYIRIFSDERSTIEGKVFIGKSLANKHCDKLIEKYHRKELGIADLTVPLGPLIERYLFECEKNGLAWMTYEHYGEVLTKIVQRYEIKTISDLCTKMKEYKDSSTLKKSTLAGEMVIVFVFCRWLIKNGHMKDWPFQDKMIPKTRRGDPKFYTHQEWDALDAELFKVDPQVKLGCYLAYYAGLRKVEIVGDGRERLGVLWEDLGWHADGSVDIRVIGKGGKVRTVPISPEIVDLLGARKSGPLITLPRPRFWYLFSECRRKAKINSTLTIHGLRHSFAKNCLQDGNMSLSAVQQLLGHSSIVTTQIYAHLEKSHLAEGIMRIHEHSKIRSAIRGHGQGKIIKMEALQDTKSDQEALKSSNEPT